MAAPVKMFSQVGLERTCRFWQKKLRLADWRVTIKFVRAEEMGDEAQGKCHWNDQARTAAIWILHPDDYKPTNYPNDVQQDIEDTIVHELLHLHLIAWDTDDKPADERFMEQAIESITGALLTLKRRTK